MRSIHRFVALLTAICFTTPAFAASLTEWRTQVQGSVNLFPNIEFAFDGGLNEPFASQTLSNSSGTAISESSSSLSANGFIPTLRAKAAITSGLTHAQAVAWGVQGYTNTSGSPLNTSLILNFTADITGGNDVEARIYLFQDEDFEFSQDPGTILFESSSKLWPGFDAFANNLGADGFDIQFKNHTGQIDETRSFDFTVDPGDSFYVWARLVATADNIGVADASSTLTASFSNIEGLTPAATSTLIVPLPAAAWMAVPLLGGLGVTQLVRRKRLAA